MRGDQPVVSAASWMVRASTGPNLTTRLSRFPWFHPCALRRGCAGRLRRQEDRLPVLVQTLVEPHRRDGRVVGRLAPGADLVERHGVVALPRRLDMDLRPGAGGRADARGGRGALGRALRLAGRGGPGPGRSGPARPGPPSRG